MRPPASRFRRAVGDTRFVVTLAAVALLTMAGAGCTSTSSRTAAPSPSETRSTSSTPIALPSSTTTASSSAHSTGERCPANAASTTVSTPGELQRALSAAGSGTVIRLEPGRYVGHFVTHGAGTESAPITLCGPQSAVLDGGNIRRDYVLHLVSAQWWHVIGFSVQDGQKGVVLDKSDHNLISGLQVTHIGDEAIHLRDFSSDNIVDANTVSGTGILRAKFGEGIYVGTAHKNWCRFSHCQVDASDRNIIRDNAISNTTAENIDIKEGTSSGLIEGNQLSGAGMTSSAATAWVNVKGNHWVIRGNHGTDSIQDGFQVHQVYPGWGEDNVFTDNTATVTAPGWGYYVQRRSLGTVIGCSNTARGAQSGDTNIGCTKGV